MTRLVPFALLLFAAPTVAAPVPKVVLTAEQEAEFDQLWDNIAHGPAARVHLYCRLIRQPEAAVAYLTRHLPPAELSQQEAKRLLKDLRSSDDTTWKRAYRDLCTRDVRLALSPLEAWEYSDAAEFRNRLGASLYDYPISADSLAAGEVTFKIEPPDQLGAKWYLFRRQHGRGTRSELFFSPTEAETNDRNQGREWRAATVIAALERIGTPDARKHLTALADGHVSSSFTGQSNAALDRLKSPADLPAGKPATLWQLDPGKFSTPATADQLLADPKGSVALFRDTVKPLTLSKKEGAKLLVKLFSDDLTEVGAALKEMRYYDLRLAMSAEDAWAEAKTATHRCRLASAFWLKTQSAWEFTRVDEGDELIDHTYHPPEPVFNRWHIRTHLRNGVSAEDAQKAKGLSSSTRLDNTLAELTKFGDDRWSREESAIYILDAIGTDDAIAIIKDMATGHPDAGPTKAAKEVLKRRGVK